MRKHINVICGFTPIMSLAIFGFGLIDLQTLAVFLVLPAYLFLIWQAASGSQWSRLIMIGWLSGVIAVGVYDLTRIPFMMMGWGDFIPKIGHWLTGDNETPAIVGYLWRYIGNGGGLGVAFASLYVIFKGSKERLVPIATAFGVAVFLCLVGTLVLSRSGQELMFTLTPLTTTGSLIGHLVFGLVLGVTLKRLLTTQSRSDVALE